MADEGEIINNNNNNKIINNNNNNTNKTTLHPAYSVTNITTKLKILDGKKVTYNAWVKMFKLNLRAYKVLDHIDGTEPPPEDDEKYPAWLELDALVIQWICNSISEDLLSRVLDDDIMSKTAREAWLKIQEVFLNNKHARAATLEQKFTNTTLHSCSSFDDYCTTLKDLASQLADVDQPVTESRLVIQMVRGLPSEYDTVAAMINQSQPTWDDARGMIESEQQRQAARPGNNRESVLIHNQNTSGSRTNNTNPSARDINRSPYPNGYRGRNYDPVKAARGRGAPQNRGGRMGNGRGGFDGGRGPPYRTNNWQQQSNNIGPLAQLANHYPQTNFSPAPYNNHPTIQAQYQPNWQPPPTPYPSAPYQFTNQAQPNSQAHMAANPNLNVPPGYSPTGTNALNPQDLGTALANMTMSYTDPQWYMDTGATSHITSDQGSQGWTPPFPTQ